MEAAEEESNPMETIRDIRRAIWEEPIICKIYSLDRSQLPNAITD
jgi:hypothetical protein